MSKYVKKLGADKTYKRPVTTYQENLSADEIADKLQGYEKVDEIADVPLNTHMRYFAKQPDGTQVFRTGGFLHNKQNAETYVMLTNGKTIWSVQVKDAIFFKKMSQKEEIDTLHAMYKKKLAEKDDTIDKLKKYIKAKNMNYDMDLADGNKADNNKVIHRETKPTKPSSSKLETKSTKPPTKSSTSREKEKSSISKNQSRSNASHRSRNIGSKTAKKPASSRKTTSTKKPAKK